MSGPEREYEVIVIGGGHAGSEAAWAAANAGARAALVTLDTSKIGAMSCNPAIGGIGKGQIVREIDALGGLMGVATDATGVMFKTLNTSKGPAVQSPRAQCDRHAYARLVQRLLASRPEIDIVEAAAERFLIDDTPSGRRIRGITLRLHDGEEATLLAPAVVLTTGTFMRGLMHTGERRTPGGRHGEKPANSISETLSELGFELGRLKTGTPPRLRRSTIDWNALEPQFGDEPPRPFSDLTDSAGFPAIEQLDCRITSTTKEAHELIRANLHRAPMFSGQIESVGPRYCPSIEDKVVRFAQRESHHVFLEPESHESDWVYCNGIATSLPTDVQEAIVHAMPGCERAEIVQFGYAVEYDMVRPHQIDATGMTRAIEGLFLAGQINGTSGYEEAGGQGLIAGINAVRHARSQDPVILGRDQAYIGVMMDDLVTRTPVEPYRMFTSRAEHRLILRADNAADRLTPLGRELGLIGDDRWALHERRRAALDRLNALIDAGSVGGKPLGQIVKAPNFTPADLASHIGSEATSLPRGVIETVLAERQYDGYIKRQQAQIKRQAKMERRCLPSDLDFTRVSGLRAEAVEALSRYRPSTIGQAGRLAGVSPADMAILLVAIERSAGSLPQAR